MTITVGGIKKLMDGFVQVHKDRNPELKDEGLEVLESTAKVALPIRATLRILYFQIVVGIKIKFSLLFHKIKNFNNTNP